MSDTSVHRTPAPSHRPIRLVVNADDFGLSEAVNAGIVAAHARGIVTATSLMAVGAAFQDAVRWCRAVPSLDVGVHLTAVGGRPLLGRRSGLTGTSGRFPEGYGAFVRLWLAGGIRPADVQAEWAAQIERVLQQGLRVSHLDSHQHLHALPGLAQRVFALADRYRIPFVRVPVESPPPAPEGLGGLGRIVSGLVLRGAWTAARLTGCGHVRGRLRFLGFAEGGRLNLARLQRLLARLRPGADYELMCHPGFTPVEPEVRRWDYRHEDELLALTHPAVREHVRGRDIRLCRFDDISEMR